MQGAQPAAAIVIPLHPGDGAIDPIHQGLNLLSQQSADAARVVDQISQDHQLSGVVATHQPFDAAQVLGIAIAR